MAVVTGRFQSHREENMGEFYRAAGLGFIARQAAKSLTLEIEFSPIYHNNGDDDDNDNALKSDDWSMQVYCIFKSFELRFQLGVPFDHETSAGLKCRTTVTLIGGNTFIQISTIDGVEVERITRVIEGDDMRVTCETKGTAGVIYLKRMK